MFRKKIMSSHTLAMGAMLLAYATGALAAIPEYQPKPDSWKSMLVEIDGEGIKDEEFATWVKQAQDAAAALMPTKDFSVICTFTQCFGGGFITALIDKGVATFGANSACKYFETAAYDEFNARSYYAHEWKKAADVAVPPTDMAITDTAYTENTQGGSENAQYQDRPVGGPPPEALHSAPHNYAILIAGQPSDFDRKDIDELYAVLIADPGPYKYQAAEILILYGDGITPPGAVGWTASGPATKARLNQALTELTVGQGGFLIPKLAAQAGTHAQLFFWTGDHGNFDTPLTFSVDTLALGEVATEVWSRALVGKEQSMLYEGGNETNVAGWEDVLNRDIDAVATGREPIPIPSSWTGTPLYFSVDAISIGKVDSGVRREQDRLLKQARSDIFGAVEAGSNRQAVDGERTLGLQEGLTIGDELNALSLAPITPIVLPNNALSAPLFFSVAGSATIYVYDPAQPMNARVYEFLNWGTQPLAGTVTALPDELDALALKLKKDDQGAFIRNGAGNKLEFDPLNDKMLFSVGRGDALAVGGATFDACDILAYPSPGGNAPDVWASCAAIGLVLAGDGDNVDALDVIGANGGKGRFVAVKAIPTLSEWGLTTLTLLLLVSGVLIFRRRVAA